VKPFVLDCSVAMAWCFEDECDRYADAVLGSLGRTEAVVPAIWPLEIANVLLVAERGKRLKKADTARFVELLGGLPIVVEWVSSESVLTRVLAGGREFRLSSYDAAYLELAMRQGLALATRDKALKSACKRGGVRLFAPTLEQGA
jgi:predicted nucleic acid-binding protein